MGGGDSRAICATNVPPLKNRGTTVVKQRNERNLLFPSKEFRDRVRSAAKERGFRSEQAFILAACENELKRGDAAEATERLEARVAATLANFAKDLQALFTLAHGQFALTNSLLQYVLTCMAEPPEEVLPAARARAKARAGARHPAAGGRAGRRHVRLPAAVRASSGSSGNEPVKLPAHVGGPDTGTSRRHPMRGWIPPAAGHPGALSSRFAF